MPKTLNKRKLVDMIARNLNHTIHRAHISNVISMFADDFLTELQQKQKIKIGNFCVFWQETSKPRKYHHLWERRVMLADGKTHLKIKLMQSLRDRIVGELDLIKTFAGEKK
jgi:nucleoid DNA-binding protein